MDAFPILASIVLAAAMIPFFIAERKRQRDFDKDFPPISDEEFIARCEPGCDPIVAIKVRKIVAEQLNVEYARIHPSSRFVEDLKAG